MVRNKQLPQHLNEEQQRRGQWNFLDGIGNDHEGGGAPRNPQIEPDPPNALALLINDELIGDDEDDVDFIPGAPGDPALRQREVHWGRIEQIPEGEDEDEDFLDEDSDDDIVVLDERVARRNQPRRERRAFFDDIEEVPVPRRERPRNRRRRGVDYGEFGKVLHNCEFYAKILMNEYLSPDLKSSISHGHFCSFGELLLHLKDEVTLEALANMPCSEFWVYVSLEIDKSAVYFEWNSSDSPNKKKKKNATSFCHFMIKGLLDVDLWQSLSCQRYFKLSLKNFEARTRVMTVVVFLKNIGLTDLKYASDSSQSRLHLGKVMSTFFGIPLITYTGEKTLKHDIEDLYSAVKYYHNNTEYQSIDVQHPSLTPQLRPYQKAAVKWMLHQEKYSDTKERGNDDDTLHCLYEEVLSKDGVTFYYNKYGGFVVKEKPLAVFSSPGGILADEMGLGKTVEVLSCMLMHPRKDVPRPSYQEPKKIESQRPRRIKTKMKYLGDDIYTLDCDIGEESNNSFLEDSQNNGTIDADTSLNELVLETKAVCVDDTLKTSDRKRNVSGHVKVHIPSNWGEHTNKSKRPKRQAARSISDYTEFGDTEEMEKEVGDDYELPAKKAMKMRAKTTTKPIYDVEKEINESPEWFSIESAIVNECWNGSMKEYKKLGSHKEFRKFLKKRKRDPYYMMSIKQRLNMQYQSDIAAYSAASAVSRKGIQGFFETKVAQKSYFECICGASETETDDTKFRVQCARCSLWQHADCVQYDVTNPFRGEYICPHCWTQETPVISGATLIVTPSSISYQ
ncbi:hypothetical protein SK128_008529, partial [Halocaridina rubra]